MSNITIKSSLYLLIGISAISWFSLAYFSGLDLSKVKDFFGLVPKVVSIDLLIIAIFVKWGWKLKMFRGWLVPFPNLNGSWTGFICSDWKNPDTGEKPPPIPVMLTLNQSFFHISCMMHTGEMESYSYSEGFLIDPDRQIKNIAYSYTSKPRLSLSDRSMPHDGTAVFKIFEKPKLKLVGRYWTERLTKGEITLVYHSKELLEEFPDDFGDHLVTESQGKIYLERESFIQSMQKLIEEPKAQRRAEKRALPDFAKTYNKQEVAALANPSGSHSMVTIADYFNVHYATISDGLKDLKARFSMS